MHQILDLTADTGFVVEAPTRELVLREAFECFAQVLYARDLVLPTEEQFFSITADDSAELLHDFLAELLQLVLYEHFLVKDVRISFSDDLSISVCACGEAFDHEKHKFFTEIKAVTRHLLAFDISDNVSRATFVLDL